MRGKETLLSNVSGFSKVSVRFPNLSVAASKSDGCKCERAVDNYSRHDSFVLQSDYLDKLLHKYGNHKSEVKPYAGCMKGTVTWMSDDFNEPLDDFKDYM